MAFCNRRYSPEKITKCSGLLAFTSACDTSSGPTVMIREKLKGNPKEEVSMLQIKLETVESQMHENREKKGRLELGKEKITIDISQLEKSITSHKAKESKQIIAQKRVQAAVLSINTIKEVRNRFEVTFREQLQEKVVDLFQTISYNS